MTCQVDFPTIAMTSVKALTFDHAASLGAVLMTNTSEMPGIDLITSSLKSFNFIPKAGACSIMEINIPGLLKSKPKRGCPEIIFLPSTFFVGCPMILKSLGSFNSIFSGTSSVLAIAAISP